jgi:predicted anti-sigma-YlaC factor YlaD
MNCKDLEELLSAYADDELSRTQKEFVEEHLSSCADCRETLAEYVQAGRRLSSLRELPESPDIRGATLSKVRVAGTVPEKMHVQWLYTLAAVIAVFIIVALLIRADSWNAGSPGGTGVMAPPPLSGYIRGYTYTLGLVAGFLMIVGLVFRIKFILKITGFMSIMFGGIGVYLGLDAITSVSKSDQSLIMGIFPLLGIIIGTVYIKKRAGRRWPADTAMFLSLVALVLYIIFLAGYHHWFSWLLIFAAVAIPVGIIGCTFRNEIIKLREIRWRPFLVGIPVAIVLIAIVVVPSLLIKSPEAMAASIVRNSPEVQAVFNGENIKEVEVTTKIIGNEGDVLVVLVKTETRQVAAEVDLKREIVTEIVRVEVPDFKPGDEQKGIDIAKADPRVSELLAQGGVISEVHLSHALVTGDGAVNGEFTVIPTVFLSIKNDANTNVRWNVVVDLQAGEVRSIGQSQPSSAMIVVNISWFVTRFVAPVLLFLGILLVSGLSFSYRRAKIIAGTAALALGIIGLFMALYSLSFIWWRLVLSVGIPAVGLIIGIADLRQRGRRRWMSIIGIVLGSLALLLVFLNAIMLNINNMEPGENIGLVIGIAAIIVGIIAYAFKEQIMSVHISGKWLRPAVVALAAIVILVLTLVQPWSSSLEPQIVLAKTHEAVANIQTYRLVYFGTTMMNGKTSSYHMEVMFASPDRYYINVTNDGQKDKFIIIGDMQYATNSASSRALIIASSDSFSSMLTKEATLNVLNELGDLQILSEETIDGVRCLHYLGKWDMEKRIEETRRNIQEFNAKSDTNVVTDEQMEEMFKEMRSIDVTHEIWIGKEDYLIRQMKTEQHGPVDKEGKISASVTMLYSDFNEPIVIEPPLDADGELLEGWHLAGSIGSNEQVFSRSITSSIGAQEGYDDYAHQEVEYSITITNNSIETVRDVRVTVTTMLTGELDKPVRVEAEPETLTNVIAPGESRRFHARIPFDATGLTKEEIIKLHDMATILVHFTTEDGRELAELLYPDAPYPTSRPVSPPPED